MAPVFFCELCKIYNLLQISEAAICKCFPKLLFLNILQSSEENTCAGIFLGKLTSLQHWHLTKNFKKFLQTPCLWSTYRLLLLKFAYCLLPVMQKALQLSFYFFYFSFSFSLVFLEKSFDKCFIISYKEACNKNRTHFIGHTKKCFNKNSS